MDVEIEWTQGNQAALAVNVQWHRTSILKIPSRLWHAKQICVGNSGRQVFQIELNIDLWSILRTPSEAKQMAVCEQRGLGKHPSFSLEHETPCPKLTSVDSFA